MSIAVITSFLQLTDNSGNLLSGGTVTVYDANSTTPRACYTDTGLSVSATNPIPINTAGRHTQGIIYISASAYKLLIKTSAGVTVATYDNIDPGVPLGAGTLAIANGGTGASSAATALSNLGAATAAELADLSAELASVASTLASTAQTHLATGTTAQRPGSPVEGDVRRNTTNSRWEGYNNSAAWEQFFTDTEIATVGEAQAGTNNTHVMTPSRTKSQLDTFAPCLLATLAASNSASLADTTSLTSTYKTYLIRLINILPATTSTTCRVRVNVAGVQTSGYLGQVNVTANGTNSVEQVTTYIPVGRATQTKNSGIGVNADLYISQPSQTATPKAWRGSGVYDDVGAGTPAAFTMGGYYNANGAVTGIQIDFSSGNITSGYVEIYGLP